MLVIIEHPCLLEPAQHLLDCVWPKQLLSICARQARAQHRLKLCVRRRSFQVLNQRYDIVFYYFSNITTVPGSKGQVGWCVPAHSYSGPQQRLAFCRVPMQPVFAQPRTVGVFRVMHCSADACRNTMSVLHASGNH